MKEKNGIGVIVPHPRRKPPKSGKKAEIIELGRHRATVGSITSRLNRSRDEIVNIVAMVEWDDGTFQLFCNAMTTERLCYLAKCLELDVDKEVGGEND